jgi:hypothetical protein
MAQLEVGAVQRDGEPRPDGRKKSLGVAACTAIVAGNMVGSGFYLSPVAVAPFGNLAILAWIVMGAGAICLGLTFAKLASLAQDTGGPYAYTRIAYGDFAGFLIAWGYWISIWTSLPVIAIAFAGAVMDLLPGLHNRPMAAALTLGAIWAVVLVNLRGVKAAGIFSEVTTYTKLVPFAGIILFGLFYLDWSHFSEFNPSGKSLLESGAALAPLTMFAYLGLESATVPAGDVTDPERTIPRSTIIGITIAALLYVLGTIAVMGLVPRDKLLTSVVLRRGARAVGALGGNRHLGRRNPFGDRRAQWVDAVDGPGAHGSGRRSAVPFTVRSVVAARGTCGRDRRLGRARHCAGVDPGGRITRLFCILQIGRWAEHDGCSHPLRLLLAGDRACCGAHRGWRPGAARDADRNSGVRFRGVHALWVRR